jgi:WD40 repeat protein
MMPNLVGQQFGNYRLTRLLGRTAFAEVYLAERSVPGKEVIFKVLWTELSENESERFLKAAQSFPALAHPHLLPVQEVGRASDGDKNFHFLVMEYVSSETLRQLHPIGISLPRQTILSYVQALSEALDYLHQHELIHGDVKPENVILGNDQQLLLTDCSIGLLSLLTDTVAGTVAYVAPEQLQGQPVTASDQYALGVVVYEWLCGELPFAGSVNEIARQHVSTPPPPLRQKIPWIPPAIEEAVLKALAKEPEQRFSSVSSFAQALEKAILGEQMPALSPAPVEQADAEQQSPLSASSETEKLHAGTLPSASASLNKTRSPQEKRLLGGRASRRAFLVGLPVLAVAGAGLAAWYFNLKTSSPGVASNAPLIYRGHVGSVTALGWSPDGAALASGGDDHTIRIWRAQTGADIFVFHAQSGSVPAISWAPDSQRIATASAGPLTSGGAPASGNAVQVWHAATGVPIYSYRGHTSGITDIAWQPGGERVASSSTDYTVQIWDATTGQHPLVHRTSPWYAWTIAWSPDGKRMASGGPDATVQVWDASTGAAISVCRGHTNSIEAVTWSPDGVLLASASDDRTVRIWDASSGTANSTYRGHTNYVRAVAWSPNGNFIASGGSDRTVQVWEATSGATIYTYYGHARGVTKIVWSPDGKYIASASEDGTVQIWSPF